MNGFGSSECSSGCESGWTMYLDQSSVSSPHSRRSERFVNEDGFFCGKDEQVSDDEEEDLSMVSDASSGPPHCHDDDECCDENGCFCSVSSASALAKKSNKRQKIKPKHQQQHPLLDDTASSPFYSLSKGNFNLNNQQVSRENNVVDFSQGFSATHFKGRSAFQKHFGFLQSKPTSTKPMGCRKEGGNQLW